MIQLALHKPLDWIDHSIGFFSRGPYTHASVILPDDTVIESRPFCGVRKLTNITCAEKKGKIIDIYKANLSSDQEKIVSEFLHKQVGKKYDYWMVGGFVWYASREGRKSYGKWFCAELAFAAFDKAEYRLLENVQAWKVNPTHLSWTNKIVFSHTICI